VAVLAAVLALAALFNQLDIRLASSQAIAIVVKETDDVVPLDDPLASVWQQAAPVEIPLSAQTTTVPMGGGSIRAVTARALHDGKSIYFRLEWEDRTRDMLAFAPQDFRDAAAIQFPAAGVNTVPFFCMGQADGQVNIWHWKADWQADIDSGFAGVPNAYPNATADFYPFQDDPTFYSGRAAGNLLSKTTRSTPVENLVAGGFGTLTTAEQQMVSGKGVWRDGRWYVLFARDLKVSGVRYAQFTPGRTSNVAFAVWDGSQGERDGLKSVSQFADLNLEGEPAAFKGGGAGPKLGVIVPLIALAVLMPAAVGTLIYVHLQRGSS